LLGGLLLCRKARSWDESWPIRSRAQAPPMRTGELIPQLADRLQAAVSNLPFTQNIELLFPYRRVAA